MMKRLIEKRKRECPFRRSDGWCTRYAGAAGLCDGACAFVVDYLAEASRKK